MKFQSSNGLEFVRYEKSPGLSSSLSTPGVGKNGYTQVGVFGAQNDISPSGGKIDIGYLVFNCLNNDAQTVTILEQKYVKVLGNDNISNEVNSTPIVITMVVS